MAIWQAPKTDWTAQDYVNYEDYERIAGNLMYLYELARQLYPEMGTLPEPQEMALGDIEANRWKSSSLPDRWDGRTAERILQIIESSLGR